MSLEVFATQLALIVLYIWVLGGFQDLVAAQAADPA